MSLYKLEITQQHITFFVNRHTLRENTSMHVSTYTPGAAFGQLALMYDCPRSATVHRADGEERRDEGEVGGAAA